MRSRRSSQGVVILEGYGLSETASTTTFNVSAEQRKVLSIGKPIWGVGGLGGRRAGQGASPRAREIFGEIVVRGHNVMKAYYRGPG